MFSQGFKHEIKNGTIRFLPTLRVNISLKFYDLALGLLVTNLTPAKIHFLPVPHSHIETNIAYLPLSMN